MSDALIGYSGFVGGNLATQTKFEGLFNSKNIEQIKGQEFKLLVCSGAPAAKWIANQNPEADLDNIKKLISCLDAVRAKQVVLISTIDVYKTPIKVDESSQMITDGLHPYGFNRLMLERFLQEKFSATIIRLPGLFGNGLKKNIIFDLINKNQLDKIHQGGVFQFYNLDWLWRDINTALKREIKLLNIVSEPISTIEVAKHGFGIDFANKIASPPPVYDVQSIHGREFGGHGCYQYSKAQILDNIAAFVKRYQSAA